MQSAFSIRAMVIFFQLREQDEFRKNPSVLACSNCCLHRSMASSEGRVGKKEWKENIAVTPNNKNGDGQGVHAMDLGKAKIVLNIHGFSFSHRRITRDPTPPLPCPSTLLFKRVSEHGKFEPNIVL